MANATSKLMTRIEFLENVTLANPFQVKALTNRALVGIYLMKYCKKSASFLALLAFWVCAFEPSDSVGAAPASRPQEQVDMNLNFFPEPLADSRREFHMEVSGRAGITNKAVAIERTHGTQEIRGRRYWKETFEAPTLKGFPPQSDYVRHSDKGIFIVRSEALDAPEYLKTPFPLTVGKRWSYTFPGGAVTECVVQKLDDATIAGRRVKNCLTIVEKRRWKDGRQTVVEDTYAPGLGLVHSVSKTGNVTVTLDRIPEKQ